MPFNSIPSKDFLNREKELALLRRLFELKKDALTGNMLLEGPRGIGKTELLKHLYRITFWEDRGIIPFYYSFKTAALKGTYFARDYFTRFVRQYLAFLRKEPFSANNMSTPLNRLIPQFSSPAMEWMTDCIDDFQECIKYEDPYSQILAAISAPVNAAQKSGKPVLVLLDDFNMAGQLFESNRGDAPGLTSLFEESMKNSLCPHIITGSPEGMLETIFSDHSLFRQAERICLSPLPEDSAYLLFSSLLEKLKISCDKDAALKFLSLLEGNPLYIKNLAKAAWKMQKKHIDKKDIRECYSHDISEGETAFYWSSVLNSTIRDAGWREGILKLLFYLIDREGPLDVKRLSRALGMRETETGQALDVLQSGGLARNMDKVFRDFLQCLHMKEMKKAGPEHIRDYIESRYSPENKTACFELIIPISPNAELVASGAIEQIGRNMNLEPDILKSLQLALIESCINAMEHSGSHEKKILLKFLVSPERLEIIIESSGKPFSIEDIKTPPPEENIRSERKRGWGLRLIKSIMDEVKVERVQDKTRVILIKNIKKNEVLK